MKRKITLSYMLSYLEKKIQYNVTQCELQIYIKEMTWGS